MLITDKNEIVRLKLVHDPSGKILEFASCKYFPNIRFIGPSIFALVDDYKIRPGEVNWMGIVLLEYNGESMEGYSGYPAAYANDPEYILKKWKDYISDTIDSAAYYNINYGS